ncbi:taste receptor type 2 member 40-like [Zootoca vivipara]|uniref:taste receptor type 2 member 40-like n=1 Tax=Zootoca vivipara TaxID=8524 RepID=UPI00293BEC94|nr:taste receptor type 2 member 40-like [Zootoca vivipara]
MVVIGLMGNGFITIAGGLEWSRNKTLSSSDMILLVLSVSRLFFLGLTLSIHYSAFADISNPKYIPNSVIFLWAFFNAVTLWTATWLAAFYCMKILTFAQPLLVKIKMGISRMVPYLLLGSVLASLLLSLPFNWFENCYQCCNGTNVPLGNSTGRCDVWTTGMLFSALLYIAGTFPSFLICLASSVFLLHSLLHHVKRMQQNREGFRDQRMDVQLRAVKMVTSFLLLYTVAFAAEISLMLFTSPLTMVLSIVMVAGYHSGHAISLIITNSKLRQMFLMTLYDPLCQRLWTTTSPSYPKTPKEMGQS